MGKRNRTPVQIKKTSGQIVPFSETKLRKSLERSGADAAVINEVVNTLKQELVEGMTTRTIYSRAFKLLKKAKGSCASRYKLKKAIYELGPTGFPFEKFMAALFQIEDFKVETGTILPGKCVSHEVDVIATKSKRFIVAECKFHSEEGKNCDVKVPLYINSRYRDICSYFSTHKTGAIHPNEGWVITNTRFTKDALDYARCAGLSLLSWDYPIGNGIKDRIDRHGLYPVTVSTLLSNREKHFLLSRDVVLYRDLYQDDFYLDHLGVSVSRKSRIRKEINVLCYGKG